MQMGTAIAVALATETIELALGLLDLGEVRVVPDLEL